MTKTRAGVVVLPTGDEIVEFGFEAALHGWCSEGSEDRIETLPDGQKTFRYPGKDFCFEDRWAVNAVNNKYAGTVTITYSGMPVFMQAYSGHYEPDVVGFVKLALRAGYESHDFSLGFRGPEEFTSREFPGLSYRNGTVGLPDIVFTYCIFDYKDGDFTSFAGYEHVGIGHPKKVVGDLSYWGAFLV